MNMTMEEAHQYEEELLTALKKINPNNPIVKKYFGSTWKAIEAYEQAIREETQ